MLGGFSMKIVKQVLCVLLMSVILLTDFIGSLFAGGVPPQKRVAARHVFINYTELNKGMDRYAAECAKILGFGEKMYIKDLEDCSYVSRPVRENSVPTAADGLINPNNPIPLYAFKDKVTFGFAVDDTRDWNDDAMVRVFDDSGKLLGTLLGSEVVDKNYEYHDDEKGIDVHASREARNYYVEFSYDKANGLWVSLPNAAFALSFGLPVPHLPSPQITIPDGSKKSTRSKSSKSSSGKSSSSTSSSRSKAKAEDRIYCYVMFSVSTFEPDLLPEEVKEAENAFQKYMKAHNMSSYSEMSQESLWNALNQYLWGENGVYISNVADLRFSLGRMSMSELNKQSMNYLTKNRISSIDSMTDAQIIALRASMIEGGFAGIPEYSRIVRDYKNKHGIKSYENMTINQLNRMERAIYKQAGALSEKYRKQQMQTKPSSSKAKSTKKKKSR